MNSGILRDIEKWTYPTENFNGSIKTLKSQSNWKENKFYRWTKEIGIYDIRLMWIWMDRLKKSEHMI